MSSSPDTAALRPDASRRAFGLALVFCGSLLWSTAGPFMRAVDHLDIWTIQTWRALFGALSLVIIVLVEHRSAALSTFRINRLGVFALVLSAGSMIVYIGALKLTTVATVLIVYATLPFVAAGVAFVVLKERVERRTLAASTLALAGVALIAGTAVRPQDLAGAGLSFLMTLSFAILLVIARRNRRMEMAPINAMAAAGTAVLAFLLSPGIVPEARDLVMLALFGSLTTGLAYFLYLTGGRHIPPAEAGLLGLLDVVAGPLLIYAFFGDVPRPAEFAGGALVLGALVWWLGADLKR